MIKTLAAAAAAAAAGNQSKVLCESHSKSFVGKSFARAATAAFINYKIIVNMLMAAARRFTKKPRKIEHSRVVSTAERNDLIGVNACEYLSGKTSFMLPNDTNFSNMLNAIRRKPTDGFFNGQFSICTIHPQIYQISQHNRSVN